jgi:hypothetical protein
MSVLFKFVRRLSVLNLGKRMKIMVVLLFFLIFLLLINSSSSQTNSNYIIKGYALNSEGNSINGNVTGVIVESGQINTSNIVNGVWELNFSGISNDAEFTVGIRVNTTNQTGYFYIKKFGTSPLEFNSSCKNQSWKLSGLVLYPERNVSGSIKVMLGDKIATGSIVKGLFDLSISSCLIPGEVYKLEIVTTSGSLYGYYSTRVIGK